MIDSVWLGGRCDLEERLALGRQWLGELVLGAAEDVRPHEALQLRDLLVQLADEDKFQHYTQLAVMAREMVVETKENFSALAKELAKSKKKERSARVCAQNALQRTRACIKSR